MTRNGKTVLWRCVTSSLHCALHVAGQCYPSTGAHPPSSSYSRLTGAHPPFTTFHCEAEGQCHHPKPHVPSIPSFWTSSPRFLLQLLTKQYPTLYVAAHTGKTLWCGLWAVLTGGEMGEDGEAWRGGRAGKEKCSGKACQRSGAYTYMAFCAGPTHRVTPYC